MVDVWEVNSLSRLNQAGSCIALDSLLPQLWYVMMCEVRVGLSVRTIKG